MEAALFGAAAEVILTTVSSFVNEEIGLASSGNQDLADLGDKVALISALLRDAQKSNNSKLESVTLWIQQMTNVMYDAEDVLEEFNYEKLSKQRNQNNLIAAIYDAHTIEVINMKLDRVVEHGTRLGLTKTLLHGVVTGESSSVPRDSRQTHPFGDVSKILGRDADKSKVVDMLLQSSSDLSVVAVIGLAGLGKTTLAKLIYKDTDNINFDKRVWVCVSTDFNVNAILKEMAVNLGIRTKETSKFPLIQDLTKELSKKKYLLILDDVWNTNPGKWNDLTDCLFEIGGDKESKILVTTRNEEVALCMGCHSRFQLRGLSDDESWSLFEEKAFSKGRAKKTAFVTIIGKKLIKRCTDVPLAILTLGALLNTKHENEWSSIENSDLWDLTTNESNIMSALRLSYNYLPSPYLKQCFAYCSIFQKDSIFVKDDLIQQWIAQGFVQSIAGSRIMLEDIGNDYFNILVWNSFFQDVEIDKYENIQFCKMNDLVHDLAQSISKSECLVWDDNKVNDSLTVRHLHLFEREGTLPTIPNGHKLRTLFLSCEVRENSFSKFKCLRVLNFENSYFIKELPKSIGKMKSLRYLNVSNTRIKEFPTSILKLYSLQTIKFEKYEYFGELPPQLGSMINLRHLCFNDYSARKWEHMPFELGRLTSLQTLPLFIVGHEKGQTIEELGSLTRLRGKLRVRYLERVKGKNEAENADLEKMTNLSELILEWSYNGSNIVSIDEEDVFEGLQPPPNLRSLKIKGFNGNNLPTWMLTTNISSYILPHSLVKIKLIDCKKCERLPTLGELPLLQILKLDGLDNLVEWSEAPTTMTVEGGTLVVFPCLEKLIIRSCKKLKIAPTHFPLLKTLEILDMQSGEAVSKICSHVTTLTYLQIESVSELTHLPEGLLRNNKKLRETRIRQCEMLECIALEDDYVGLQNLVSLQKLYIAGCPKLTHIGNMHGLTSLIELTIQGCNEIKHIGSIHDLTSLTELSIENCNEIRDLPIGLGSCTSLEVLVVDDCRNLREEEGGLRDLKSLNRLKTLRMGGFYSELESFPFNFSTPSLQKLQLYGWLKLKSLPHQNQHLTNLQLLKISGFSELEALPDWFENLSSLQTLQIVKCPKLSHIGSMHGLTSLTKFSIRNCNEITNLSIGLGSCTPLESLWVEDFGNLREEGLRDLKSLNRLKTLWIGGFYSELESFPFNFITPSLQNSLKYLRLVGWPKLNSLPPQIQHLAALEVLMIHEFQGLETLPDWLGNLSSLRMLQIVQCQNLKYLPSLQSMFRLTIPSLQSMRRLTNLQRLEIWRCPVLEERCNKETGPEWSKISHIPIIRLNFYSEYQF